MTKLHIHRIAPASLTATLKIHKLQLHQPKTHQPSASKLHLALSRFQLLDLNWCIKLNRYSQSRAIALFFKIISRLGDGWIWYLTAFLLWWLKGIGYSLQMLYLLNGFVIGLLIYKILKHKTVRPRPYQVHQAVVLGERPLDHFSFPSGHTMHATLLTILMGYVAPVLLWLLVPFTLLVAISRVILGLHYPTDVLAGALIGSSLALVLISAAPFFRILL